MLAERYCLWDVRDLNVLFQLFQGGPLGFNNITVRGLPHIPKYIQGNEGDINVNHEIN